MLCVTGVEPGSMGTFCYGEVSTSQPYACTGGSHGTLYINYHNVSMLCSGNPRCLVSATETSDDAPTPAMSMDMTSKEDLANQK